MHLIYDIYTVFSNLRRYPDLLHQALDVFYAIVGGCVQFVDAVGATFGKGTAGLALPARLHLR